MIKAPEYGSNEKETIQNLMDAVFKMRKELNFILYNLDDRNIPQLGKIIGDVDGMHTIINQTESQITLLAQDVLQNSASITIQADQIQSLVTDVSGFGSSITQLSNQISLKVGNDQVISAINISPESIRLQSSRLDIIGATTFRAGVNKDFITINDNTLLFQEYATGNAKMAFGFVPDRNGVNIPGIVLGAGSGQGNNRGYITKDADSLDIFYISNSGVVNYISLDEGGIKLNDKIIPVADQNGKLVDSYIASATSWNGKIDETVMKTKLQDPAYAITIPKENIGVLDENNIQIDYAEIANLVAVNLEVDTAQIKNAAITTAKIQDASITSAKIGTAQIGSAHIEDASITTAKIANASIDAAKIGNAVITNAHITNATITGAKIASATIGSANIIDATITGAKIANATIGNANIQNATITGAKIATATIATANIATGAITNALIATGAIQTAQIADASITDAKIVELTANKINAGTLSVERLVIRDPVTPANSLVYAINNISGALQSIQGDTLNGEILTPRTITADRIVAGAITANEIAAATITANQIASNTITAAQMATGTITAASGIIGSIDAATITTGSINANRISGGTISGVTIDVSTTATVGNLLQVGGSGGIGLESNNGLYVKSGSSHLMKIFSNYTFFGGSGIAIANNGEIGIHGGITGTTATGYIKLSTSGITLGSGTPGSGHIVGLSASGDIVSRSVDVTTSLIISSGGTLRRGTLSSSSSLLTASSSGLQIDDYARFANRAQFASSARFENTLVMGPSTSIAYDSNSTAWSTGVGTVAMSFTSGQVAFAGALKHNGTSLSFFNKATVSKQSVTALSALTMPTTAPTTFSSTWAGQVRTDVNNLRTSVDAIRTALVNYGLL